MVQVQLKSSEIGRAYTQDEKLLIALEKKYMKILLDLFKTKAFSNLLLDIELYVKENYDYLNAGYNKTNKIEIAIERILRFHIHKNYGDYIKFIYVSTISSDIGLELDDIILNIDSKTLDYKENPSDFNSFHFESNQSSFLNEPIGKNDYFEGIEIKSALPTRDPGTKKPILTFVIRIGYFDNKKDFKLYNDEKNKNISLTCLPNGELSKLFKGNIVFGCKTYDYYKKSQYPTLHIGNHNNIVSTYNENFKSEFKSFEELKIALIKIGYKTPANWEKEVVVNSRYGFYDSIIQKGWVIVPRKNSETGIELYFEAIEKGHTYRVNYDTLKFRVTENDEPWQGYEEWDIERE